MLPPTNSQLHSGFLQLLLELWESQQVEALGGLTWLVSFFLIPDLEETCILWMDGWYIMLMSFSNMFFRPIFVCCWMLVGWIYVSWFWWYCIVIWSFESYNLKSTSRHIEMFVAVLVPIPHPSKKSVCGLSIFPSVCAPITVSKDHQ